VPTSPASSWTPWNRAPGSARHPSSGTHEADPPKNSPSWASTSTSGPSPPSGGRLAIADIVTERALTDAIVSNTDLWASRILHAVGNAFGHPFTAEYLTLRNGTDYLGSVGTGLIPTILFAGLGLAIVRRRRTGPTRSLP
jgi:hypothetical protein